MKLETLIFTEIIEAVAGLLGYECETQNCWHREAWLIKDESKIWAELYDGYIGPRIRFGGALPRPRDGHYHTETKLEITVTAEKMPEEITGDIKRRLLPVYMRELAKAVAHCKQADREAEVRAETIMSAAALVGKQDECSVGVLGRGRVYWGDSAHLNTVENGYEADRLNVTLCSVTVTELEAIVKALARFCPMCNEVVAENEEMREAHKRDMEAARAGDMEAALRLGDY